MTVHNKKLTHITGPGVILECSCGQLKTKVTGGSRKACEERADAEFEKHLEEQR